MPIISIFFGIIIRMYYFDHQPPHIHAEYQDKKAIFDFRGNILKGDLHSRTAVKLIREWIDLRQIELLENWEMSRDGKEIRSIDPLN